MSLTRCQVAVTAHSVSACVALGTGAELLAQASADIPITTAKIGANREMPAAFCSSLVARGYSLCGSLVTKTMTLPIWRSPEKALIR